MCRVRQWAEPCSPEAVAIATAAPDPGRWAPSQRLFAPLADAGRARQGAQHDAKGLHWIGRLMQEDRALEEQSIFLPKARE